MNRIERENKVSIARMIGYYYIDWIFYPSKKRIIKWNVSITEYTFSQLSIQYNLAYNNGSCSHL